MSFSHLAWLAVATLQDMPPIDGARLSAGEACYAIMAGDRAIGATLQTIREETGPTGAVWEIVIHQRVPGAFELRDRFLLDRSSLRPLSFESRRGRDPSAADYHLIRLTYSSDRVTGTRTTAAGEQPIEQALTGPVWEGNLWGLTFAALPLEAGRTFEIPFWQYDKGFGGFSVSVVRQETADDGRDVWLVEAGSDPARRVQYRFDVVSHAELGYARGGMAQRLGGDCGDLKVED